MLKISVGSQSTFKDTCEFTGEACPVKGNSCETITIATETVYFKAAKNGGLRPSKVPGMWHFLEETHDEVTEVSLCRGAVSRPHIAKALVEFVRMINPERVVTDEVGIARLKLAERIANGEFEGLDMDDLDESMLALLDKKTSNDPIERNLWPTSTCLTYDGNVVQAIDVYV